MPLGTCPRGRRSGGPTRTVAPTPPRTPPAGPRPGDEPPADGARRPWWRRRAVLIPARSRGRPGGRLRLSTCWSPQVTSPLHRRGRGRHRRPLPAAAARPALDDLAPRVAADRTVVADDMESTLSPVAAGSRSTSTRPWSRGRPAAQPLDPAGHPVRRPRDRPGHRRRGHRALRPDRDVAARSTGRRSSRGRDRRHHPGVAEAADGGTLDREGSAEAIIAALAQGGDPPRRSTCRSRSRRCTSTARRPSGFSRRRSPRAVGAVYRPRSSSPAAEYRSPRSLSLTFTPRRAAAHRRHRPRRAAGGSWARLEVFGSGAEDARSSVSGGTVTVVPSVDGVLAPAHLAEQLLPVLTQPGPPTLNAELGPGPGGLHHRGGPGARREGGDRQLRPTSATRTAARTSAWSPRRSTARWSCRARRSA